MRVDRLQPSPAVQRAPGQLKAGFRYVRGIAGLWVPLVMMALIGTLAYEFQVVLPVLARFGIHGGARTYGFLASAMGLGAVVGGLIVAAFGRAGVVPLVGAAAGFGAALSAATFVPSLPGELIALAFVGVGSIAFLATGNTTLQLVADPSLRGRVMGLWTVTFFGSTPVGGPIVGVVVQHFGPRAGLGVGAAACLAAATLGLLALPRVAARHRLLEHRPPPGQPPPSETDSG